MRMSVLRAVRTCWLCQEGQDLIEYALMAGFLTVLAAASIPGAFLAVERLYWHRRRSERSGGLDHSLLA